jgi:hypothetical protein
MGSVMEYSDFTSWMVGGWPEILAWEEIEVLR